MNGGRIANYGEGVTYCPAEERCTVLQDAGGGGCSVNWRNVWASAVVGFFSVGASTAYVGATVGTVTVPRIGTVTGGVAGFFAEGAVGFVSGATTTIVAGLITSCGR